MRPSINNGRDSLLSIGESLSQLQPKISYSALKEKFLSPTLRKIDQTPLDGQKIKEKIKPVSFMSPTPSLKDLKDHIGAF